MELAEKVATLRALGLLNELSPEEQIAYLKGRADRARPGALEEILVQVVTTGEVLPGDELPEEWLRPPVAPD
jgi:hypothetical protein